jgi:hypothetical protein
MSEWVIVIDIILYIGIIYCVVQVMYTRGLMKTTRGMVKAPTHTPPVLYIRETTRTVSATDMVFISSSMVMCMKVCSDMLFCYLSFKL